MSAKRFAPVVLAVTAAATLYVGGQQAFAAPAASTGKVSTGFSSTSSSDGTCATPSAPASDSGWSNPFSSASGEPCVYIPTSTWTETATPPPSSHSTPPPPPPTPVAPPAQAIDGAPAYTG